MFDAITLGSFFAGIFSSVIGSYLFLVSQSRTGSFLRNIALNLAKVPIAAAFSDRVNAEKDITERIQSTNKLKILSVRGAAYIDPAHPGSLVTNRVQFKDAKVLVCNPYGRPGLRRAKEVQGSADKSWNVTQFPKDIEHMFGKLEGENGVQVRYFCSSTAFRVVILDSAAYLSGFPSNRIGFEVPVLKFHSGSDFYNMLEKYFDEVWEQSLNGADFSDVKLTFYNSFESYSDALDDAAI
tara:strand:+ start:25984 stop:26700 length:717 start_codon:yes stop_codon:yes gene_type:complete